MLARRLALLGGGVFPMPQWAAAKAAVAAGTRNSKLVCIGDSTTGGAYASVLSPAFQDARALSWPMVAGSALPKANVEPWSGANGVSVADMAGYNPRFTSLGTWTTAVATLGGDGFYAAAAAGTITYAPSGAFDTVEIWTPQDVSAGALSVNIDGGSATVITETGSPGYVKTTLTTTLGTHVINLSRSSGNAYLSAIIPYDSTAKANLVFQCGVNAQRIAGAIVNSKPYSPLSALQSQAPDLTIICLTVNDAADNTATSTFEANTQTLINTAKLSGDVILMTGVPSRTTTIPFLQQQAKVTSYKSLAARNGLNLIDMWARWGSWEAANANGWMANDLHPNAAGYAQIATVVRSYL